MSSAEQLLAAARGEYVYGEAYPVLTLGMCLIVGHFSWPEDVLLYRLPSGLFDQPHLYVN